MPSGVEGRSLVCLVTNRHVLQGKASIVARLNTPAGSNSLTYDIPLENQVTFHDDHDVAAIRVRMSELRERGAATGWFDEGMSVSHAAAQNKVPVSEGDGVFILGFPLGLAGEERNYAIVRQGIIARSRDWLNGVSDTILIDAFVFPGNSGGPVITRPEVSAVTGTQANQLALLLGMVRAYEPYEDVAVSTQTGRPRVVFQENSGLATVVPVDAIRETVEKAVAPYRQPQPGSSQSSNSEGGS